MQTLYELGLANSRNARLLLTLVIVATLSNFSAIRVANAQGVLIPDSRHHHDRWRLPRPRPNPVETSYTINEIAIDARIKNQVARTSVTQTFVNTGNRQIEAQFIFPLPYEGAVDQMTFMVDGKEIPAKLLPADEARRIYQGYVQRYKDPALLQWVGHGMFQTNVFPIPAGAKRTVTLKYTQLLQQDLNVTDYLFPLSTAKYTSKPIESFSFRASIESETKIKSVYSPTHDIAVDRPDDKHAIVKLEKKNFIPATDLRVLFDHHDSPIGASIVSYWPSGSKENGYFLLMASPEVKSGDEKPMKKTVIFVVDRSGSMNGKKIEQAREAAKFVLNNLREGDLFNIIAYDADVETFKPELQRYSEEISGEARGFIEGINAGGSTNIDGALSTALEMVKDSSNPNYMLFLTDGLPTAGEQNEAKIVKNAKTKNAYSTRIISFGVGYDVNSRLLDRLTRANRGQSQYVRPNENLEEHVSRLYEKISAPVMTDLTIEYQFDTADNVDPINRVYPKDFTDLFAGQQLVLVGRYRNGGKAKIKLSGKVGGSEKEFNYSANFSTAASSNEQFAFVAKLWAVRRIGELIDLIDLEGRNEELIKELVDLSTEHGIVTQYTAFLADPNAPVNDLTQLRRMRERTSSNLYSLEDASGESGFGQRLNKQSFKNAQRAAPSINAGVSGGAGYAGGSNAGVPGVKGGVGGDSVRQAGQNTLYRRGNTVIASNARDIDIEKDKSKINEINRFSDKYFELLKVTNSQENQILAAQGDNEQLVVRLQGKVYLIK